MNCLTQRQLIAYMEDRLTPMNKRNVESHLDHCTHCQYQLEQWIDELHQTEETMWEDSLSANMDQKIIQMLSPHPVRVLNPAIPSHQPPAWKQRSITIMKRMTIAAAALTVVVSGGMLVSPTFASYVHAAFTNSPIGKADPVAPVSNSFLQQIADKGIAQAAKNGFAQSVNVSATDQGLTFTVHEVVADPLRISIAASLNDKNGKPLDSFMSEMVRRSNREPLITIKDKQGNILTPSEEKNAQYPNKPWHVSMYAEQGVMNLDRELRSCFDDISKVPDELIVEFNIKQLDDIKGNWKLSVPVDMKKAKAAMKTHEINKAYTTPQGLKLNVKQITFAPSGVEMVIDRTLAPSEKNAYSYELVDEKGKVVAAWDSTSIIHEASKRNNLINDVKWDHTQSTESGARDFHYFYPIDESQNLTFKLGSVYTEESAKLNAKLDTNRLEKKEVITAEEQGDQFTFKKYQKDPNAVVDVEGYDGHYRMNDDGTATKLEGYHLAFEATLSPDAAAMGPYQYWTITDETGKKYEDIEYLIDKTEYENERAIFGGMVFLENLTTLPKQLIITSDKRMVEHKNVEWEVPISAGK
ncbi:MULTISPECIES: DUF4179 domain-containing protein [Brevibacillus]|uniref:DUF4179 domain-containing protein n=1 Tax=Brevibacillus TaxID=55080 RepID=UPI000D0F2B7B|nr:MULTISPECIES: DUF4179 domain-containing protein [Brevibacillus]MED1945284.1 DUF4179 domain-containing protein [Brevibacillus formosus]MED1998593.1 DUF4179 domain-containing protein [Brevibacillus formosus]MED2083562.1 DUF4179 domain-containing protein [Brevibacillus formosus]PSK20955.1 hypothetical protein C7R94_02460 [Brevibacillus sp. NRRL NRS-603]